MKLAELSIERYRSMQRAEKLQLHNYTVLIGPNNEGKTNVVRALATGMKLLSRLRSSFFVSRRDRPRPYPPHSYSWHNDFPLQLQQSDPDGASVITLCFELTDEEVTEFRSSIGSSLNGLLPIRLELRRDNWTASIRKPGRGAKTLAIKSDRILHFVARKIEFAHIPAVRTAEAAERVITRLVAAELYTIESQEDYKKAISQIERLQEPVLRRLGLTVKSTLADFMPDLRDVSLTISEEARAAAFRRTKIWMDDGVRTELAGKGDGVQSLTALALMKHASESGASGKQLLIAIEEPESHLHPRAIHRVQQVLASIATVHQVIISSHCPILVDRSQLAHNIVVANKKARPATSIEAIRESLGVRISDNLRHAEAILYTEGQSDADSICAILSTHSNLIKDALSSGRLAIRSMYGAGNLLTQIGVAENTLCKWHVLLDNDDRGKAAFRAALEDGMIDAHKCTFASIRNKPQSELEDLIAPAVYAESLQERFPVSLNTKTMRSKKKWSIRLQETFVSQGLHWDDAVKGTAKRIVAERVVSNPDAAVLDEALSLIDALRSRVEATLSVA